MGYPYSLLWGIGVGMQVMSIFSHDQYHGGMGFGIAMSALITAVYHG